MNKNLDIRKTSFTVRTITNCNNLPRKVVEYPSTVRDGGAQDAIEQGAR